MFIIIGAKNKENVCKRLRIGFKSRLYVKYNKQKYEMQKSNAKRGRIVKKKLKPRKSRLPINAA